MKVLLFDTFGTLVDWRTSLIAVLTEFGRQKGRQLPAAEIVDRWRAAYEPMMARVRTGKLPWTDLDSLHRMALTELLPEFQLSDLTPTEIDQLTLGWHQLSPWPDSVPGLTRLKRKFILAPLSNGNFSLLVDLAKFASLPWDAILGVDLFKHYKPDPATYLGACELLKVSPEEVMLVAAHNYDLKAAQSLGFKTAFVARPTEYGPRQSKDFGPEGAWDFVARDMIELAERLGC
ncbi:MAG: haloacid dehalogenase type II [Verrucomicrobia bacterium]|nr:haloacid dehalogenase type II [Verrucomicrobiota bacterium]MBV8274031.1 haloacid dehalogenase type II [Verrucomicrobiota bacterium]